MDLSKRDFCEYDIDGDYRCYRGNGFWYTDVCISLPHYPQSKYYANDIVERQNSQMDHPRLLLRHIPRLVRRRTHARETAVTEGLAVVGIP
jgi:hypothetical protein